METYLPILHIYSYWGWDLWEVIGIGWVETGRPDDIGSFIRWWGEEAGLLLSCHMTRSAIPWQTIRIPSADPKQTLWWCSWTSQPRLSLSKISLILHKLSGGQKDASVLRALTAFCTELVSVPSPNRVVTDACNFSSWSNSLLYPVWAPAHMVH